MQRLYILVFLLFSSVNCLLYGQIDYDEINNTSELEKDYEKNNIIFSGIVFKIELHEMQAGSVHYSQSNDSLNRRTIILQRIYFTVTEVFKGIEDISVIEVVTNAERKYSGYPFEVGKEYIVYGIYQNRLTEDVFIQPGKEMRIAGEIVPIFVYTGSSQRTKAYDRAEAIKLRRLAEKRYYLPDE